MKAKSTRKILKVVKKKGMQPAKGKTWMDKVREEKAPQVKRIDKAFADIPPGGVMLIATPKILDTYIREIPKGKSVNLSTIRKDLASEYHAEYTCPITTGIFLRIVSEAAHEEIESGTPIGKVAPFWRAVDENSPLAKKLSFGSDFVKAMRKKEGIIP